MSPEETADSEPRKSFSLSEQLEKMRRDWDERARQNARHYVADGRVEWSDEDFFASGEDTVAIYILNDPTNIYQGRDPSTCESWRLVVARAA
jgi:hypothetical protein